jgi:hypothetical protein
MNHVRAFQRISALICMVVVVLTFASPLVSAAEIPRDFSLQVSPSPLVTTVKPGVPSSVELKIHNSGTSSENLKVEPRSFKLSKSGNITVDDTTPPDIANWITFSQQKFTIDPGQTFSERVNFNLPKETGFSYSFVLIINRQSEAALTSGGRLIKGSLAVFTLVNVDRPGATRKLDAAQLTTDHKLYEFLPAKINVGFKNVGNTIVQPYGNIFIHRGKSQLASLPVNEQRGYILPGTTRVISTEWNSGFPVYKKVVTGDASKQSLSINWSDVSKLRIGKYTAKLVAVYNDGGHDVPIEGEVSFWLIPIRPIILLIIIIAALWYLQHWINKRRTQKAVKRALEQARKTEGKS